MGKRGAKRKAGKREPNGQLSRKPEDVAARNIESLDREERETIAVAMEARERVWGVPVKHSRDQMAGSFIGRLRLQGDISAAQYDAAMMFLEQKQSYDIAMRAPRPPGAVDLNATKGGSGDYENVRGTQRACNEFELAQRAVQRANAESSNRGCNLLGALGATVLRDVELDHLVGDTRIGLNVLVRHYGLSGERKAT